MRRLDAPIILLIIAVILGVVMRAEAWHENSKVDVLRISSDSESYDGIARNLLAGKGYSGPNHMIARKDKPTAFYAPTYPFYLVVLYFVFGISQKVAQISHMILSAATIPLVYILGKRLYGRIEGGIASLIYAVSPQIIHYNLLLDSETLFMVLEIFLLILVVGIFKKDRPSLWLVAGTGLVFSIAYLCRQTVIFFPVLMVAALWLRFKNQGSAWLLKSIGIFLIAAVSLVIPWTIRNYIVFGEPVYSTTTGPATLWWGTYEDKGTSLGPLVRHYRQSHPDKNEIQMSHMMTKEAIQRIKRMSGADMLATLHQRVRRLFGFPRRYDYDRYAIQMWVGVSYLLLGITGIAGLFIASRKKYERQLIVMIVILTMLLHIFTMCTFRYLMPLVPLLGLGVGNLVSLAATRIKGVLQARGVRLTAS